MGFRSIVQRFISFLRQYTATAIIVTAGVVATAVVVVRTFRDKPTLPAISVDTTHQKKIFPPEIPSTKDTLLKPQEPESVSVAQEIFSENKHVDSTNIISKPETSRAIVSQQIPSVKETTSVAASPFSIDSTKQITKAQQDTTEKISSDTSVEEKKTSPPITKDEVSEKEKIEEEKEGKIEQEEGEGEEKKEDEKMSKPSKGTVEPRRDTLRRDARIDSIALGLMRDTSYIIEGDSSERIRQWNSKQRVPLFAYAFSKKQHSFSLAVNHPAYEKKVEMDTSGTFIFVREFWYGKDMRIPQTMTLDEYIKERIAYEQRKLWEDSVYLYRFKNEGKDALGSLFGTITNIDIPIPANPLFSIFGPPRINLHVSGSVDIHAGFRTQKSDLVSTSARDQLQTDPNFNQEVQVNVNGTIGDKLNILSDWNTQRTFEYENQLKLKYTGYDDEIIQSVEAGNVSMQAPGFFGSSAALFGVKAKMQLGPVTLYSLVSQKKGQIKDVTVKGGSKETPFEVKPWDYSTNHYFVDTLYRSKFVDYYNNIPSIVDARLQIKDEEVWITRSNSRPEPGDRKVVALLNLPSYLSSDTIPSVYDSIRVIQGGSGGDTVVGSFYKLEKSEYTFHRETGYITLNRAPSNDQAIAIAYRIEGNTGNETDDEVFGEFSSDNNNSESVLILKLVRPKNLLPSYTQAWKMQLKNILSLGAKNLKDKGFELKIFYEKLNEKKESINPFGQEVKLVTILGLDKRNAQGATIPDGEFDFAPGLTIDQSRGEIIFPTLRPFDSTIINYFNSTDTAILQYTFHQIYDSTLEEAKRVPGLDNYIIRGKYTADITSRFNLGFNVVEGSVKVLHNGSPLIPNVDYTVDYILGDVIIKNESALVPGADLQILFEQNDLFQLASKTLLGARLETEPFPNTILGATLMNLNQQTLSDKVRLTEEPTNNLMMGFDFKSSISMPLLTDALNALPLFQTREPSEIVITAEAAYMDPNANTKKSTIVGETDKSIAYIDDFEGAQRSITLGTSFSQWKLASPPKRGYDADTTTATYRSKLMWYTPPSGTVISDSIWPKRSTAAGENNVTVLDLRMKPRERGMYNYTKTTTDETARELDWAGIMRAMSSSSNNLVNQNMSYIEIWMQVRNNDDLSTGKMMIDLGQISEDIIPNYTLNSEDLIAFSVPNGILNVNEGEDVGLDMLTDEQERNADTLRKKLKQPVDPTVLIGDASGDNYDFAGPSSNNYSNINGTDNNHESIAGRFPDTEDLNGNNNLDVSNNYFEYEIDLNTSVPEQNPLIVGGGNNGWYQFRIPLSEATRRIGTPTLENVEYIRVWLSGFQHSTDVLVRIADFSIVGNQWLEYTRNDSVLKTSVVNVEDNPEYSIPPGVVREKDKTKPDQNVQFNEQALALIVTDMPDARNQQDSAKYQAVRYFTSPMKPLDVLNYKQMKMFVHGEQYNAVTRNGFRFIDSLNYDADFYIRFGNDANNYYEYRAPLRPAGSSITPEQQWPKENFVTIDFAELTSLKQGRDSATTVNVKYRRVSNGVPRAYYGVRGNPSLSRIAYIGIGVTNPPNNPSPQRFPLDLDNVISGVVWVNELRLVDVDNTPGWAYRINSSVKLADLGNVRVSYSETDPFFHTLEQRFGSREVAKDLGFSFDIGFEKFLPQSWQGTTLPFSYTYSQRKRQPRYFQGTDIIVEKTIHRLQQEGNNTDSLELSSQTRSVAHVFAMPTIHFAVPSNAWFIDQTINRLSFSANYNIQRDTNPQFLSSELWGWNGRISYDLSFPADYYIQPFKTVFANIPILKDYKEYKFFYTPGKIQWNVDARRDRKEEIARAGRKKNLTSNFLANRSFGFGWKVSEGGLLNVNGSYSLSAESVPTHLEEDSSTHTLYSFSKIVRKLFVSKKIVDLGEDSRYGQNVSLQLKPTIPNVFDIPKYLDLGGGYKVDYGWSSKFQGEIGQSAGWSNQIDLGFNVKLKQLADLWFPVGTGRTEAPKQELVERGRGRGMRERKELLPDSTQKSTPPDTTYDEKTPSVPIGEKLGELARMFLKVPLLDYDNIQINFSQTNKSANSGIAGENATGLHNFWGSQFFSGSTIENGPSALYQLGLTRSPGDIRARKFFQPKYDTLGNIIKDSLGRILGDTIRPQLVDDYGQTNKLTLKTSRNLWEGARIELNWSVGWANNENEAFNTDFDGNKVASSTSFRGGGSIDRTFLMLPIPLFKPTKSYLKNVGTIALKKSSGGSLSNEDVAKAFEEGLETFPILSKILGEFVPRANYSFRWGGLEKMSTFTGIFSSLSFEHTYQSTFTRTFTVLSDRKTQRTENAKVMFAFQPLAGINATFVEMWKGNLNFSLRYNTQTAYDLVASSADMKETFTREIAGTLGYTKRGFEIPLFGFSLQNDIDFSFNFTLSENSANSYDVLTLAQDQKGIPQGGTTRTQMEPRIRYILSSRVSLAIFYRYTSIKPDEGGSNIPGTTTNEAGLDLKISIQ